MRLAATLCLLLISLACGSVNNLSRGEAVDKPQLASTQWRLQSDPSWCVAPNDNPVVNGTTLVLAPCSLTTSLWSFLDGQLKVDNLCVQPALGVVQPGVVLELRACDPGSTLMRWTAKVPGLLAMQTQNLCVDLRDGQRAAGAALQLWPCNAGDSDELWQLGEAPGSNSGCSGNTSTGATATTGGSTSDGGSTGSTSTGTSTGVGGTGSTAAGTGTSTGGSTGSASTGTGAGSTGGASTGTGAGSTTGSQPPPEDPTASLLPAPGKWNYVQNYRGGSGPTGTRKIAPELTGPVPTNTWWSSLVWNLRGDNPYSLLMYPHPLSVRADADGLAMFYIPQASVGGDAATSFYMMQPGSDPGDVHVSLAGLQVDGTEVERFSDWSVTALWRQADRALHATITKGSPYVYFETEGGQVQTRFTGANVFSNSGPTLGVIVRGQPYGLFAPNGATWQLAADAQSATTDLAGATFFSVAVLPDAQPATLATFAQHAFAFIKNTRVTWGVDHQAAQVVTRFDVEVDPKQPGGVETATPLLALYPHQWKNSSAPTSLGTYASPRGTMRLLDASTFTTVLPYGGVLPALPPVAQPQQATLTGLLNAEHVDPAGMGADSYNAGKVMAMAAHLALVADGLGRTDVRDAGLTATKQALSKWFDGASGQQPLFGYNSAWTTLIGYPAGFGSDQELNDHHFHWGYMIMAAAITALYDPVWAEDSNYGGLVKLLIRDAASPVRNDPLFPFLRTFDPYEGHHWASGHANFAAGNNQESSSEAMNFAGAVILWGVATGDAAIADFGTYLYATGQSSVEQHWFDVDRDTFPPSFTRPALGIVWGAGGAYATWWTSAPEAIHGINFLPFTGASLYLGAHPDYLQRNYAGFMQANGGRPEGAGGTPNNWPDIIWEAQALWDPSTASAKLAAQLNTYPVFYGETRSHTFAWIEALHGLGQVDPSVRADVTAYAVFRQAAGRTYVAYNPTCQPLQVHFTNGFSMQVAARTLQAQGQISSSTPLGAACTTVLPARHLTAH